MAWNQGGFTVVVKRSRRVIGKETRLAPAVASAQTSASRGWAEAATGDGMAFPGAGSTGSEANGSDARRAAEKLFAPRNNIEPRIPPTVGNAAVPVEATEAAPVVEPAAVLPPSNACAATAGAEANAPAAQSVVREAAIETTAPVAARRGKRHARRSVLPPGESWRTALPESCWPEELRRVARRSRRRAARAVAGKGEPGQ